jgi:hypothetical protein
VEGGRVMVQPELYHLTSLQRWEEIERDGELVSFVTKLLRGDGPAPVHSSRWDREVDELVWLTANPEPDQRWQGHVYDLATGLRFVPAFDPAYPPWGNRSLVRITLDAPRLQVVHWPEWARACCFPRKYLALLALTGGNPAEWWISSSPIPRRHWLRVEQTFDGTVLWERLGADNTREDA